MYKKKLVILSIATLIPLSQPLWAEQESEQEASQPAADVQSEASSSPAAESESEAATAPEATAAPEAAAGDSSDTASGEPSTAETGEPPPGYTRALNNMKAHMQQRNQEYAELKKRAQAMGVILPEKPPWSTPGGVESMMEERMQAPKQYKPMSQEELETLRKKRYEEMDTLRKQHYEEMRERAKAAGVDMPGTPPWEQRQAMSDDDRAKQQAIIDAMTDEQRAACQAMSRSQMGMWDRPPHPMMPRPGMGRGMGPGMMDPGYGYGPDAYGYGPDYGHGPDTHGYGPGNYGYGPDSYGYGPDPYAGRQNFWNPGNP